MMKAGELQYPVKYLRWSFLSKINNNFYAFSIFAIKSSTIWQGLKYTSALELKTLIQVKQMHELVWVIE